MIFKYIQAHDLFYKLTIYNLNMTEVLTFYNNHHI